METIKYYHKNSDVLAFKKETDSEGFSSERTYDENGYQLTYKNSNGYSSKRTYDEKGNQLTYKDSDGVSSEKTYDEKGNVLTHKDSYGYSWERTCDEKANELTYKNSDGFFRIKGKNVSKEEFEEFIHNHKRPCAGKKVIVDGVEYELK
jgi:YD repeat-containing protein